MKIIYKTFSLSNQFFRLNLYKISQPYLNINDFHYIACQRNQLNSSQNLQWTIRGRYETSTFLTNLFFSNKNLSLQTTANVNLSINIPSISIPSSDFDIRHVSEQSSDFILVLYEQQNKIFSSNLLSNQSSDLIQTNDFISYDIQTVLDSIDFILIKVDNGTVLRLYDLSKCYPRG